MASERRWIIACDTFVAFEDSTRREAYLPRVVQGDERVRRMQVKVVGVGFFLVAGSICRRGGRLGLQSVGSWGEIRLLEVRCYD